MKVSRALAVAAHGMNVQAERLRTIAQALAKEQRSAAQPTRRMADGVPTGLDLRDIARHRQASLQAMQASRTLLTRTIGMLNVIG